MQGGGQDGAAGVARDHQAHHRPRHPVQATWCEFCKKSLQPLDSVARRYAERGVQMLAVTREDTEDVDEFLAKMKRVLSMAVAVDEGSALTQRCAILLCAALARLARFRSLESALSPSQAARRIRREHDSPRLRRERDG